MSPQLRQHLASLQWGNPSTLLTEGLCGQETQAVVESAKRLEIWAMKMLDSSAKLPSGILNGNVNQFGDFDQCLGVRHEESNITGKYCLAFLDVRPALRAKAVPYLEETLKLIHSHHAITSNFTDPGYRIPRFSTMNWAVCAPSSCYANQIEEGLRKQLNALRSIPELNVEISVDPNMCYLSSQRTFELDPGTLFTLVLFGAIVGFTVIGTIIDSPLPSTSEKIHQHQSITRRCVLAFSLRRNVRQLLDTRVSADDLQSAHGVRFINAIGLILCHKSMALFFDPFINRTTMAERLSMPWTVLGRTAIIYTDPFILLSGLLITYSMLPELDRTKKIDLRTRFITRLFRILPNFTVTILFCTYVMQFLGSGPQWNIVIKHYSDVCKQTMWRNFLFIHNYFGFETMCLTHTHQVGIDMQLFLWSPLAVYLLWKWPRVGLTVLTGTAAFSTWLRYSVTYAHQLSSVVFFGISVTRMFSTARMSYIIPFHRATSYIMGILLGYFLRRNPRLFEYTKGQTIFLWTMVGLSTIYPWFSPYSASSMTYKYDAFKAALYAAFYPILWNIFTIGLIVLCLQQKGGRLGSFFRWRGFAIYTKISYAVYLTQFPIYFYNVGTRRTASYSTIMDLVNIPEVICVFAASIALTLLVDLPFQEIRKITTVKSKVKVSRNLEPIDDITQNGHDGSYPQNKSSRRVAGTG